MTAVSTPRRNALEPTHSLGMLPGLGGLFRKELSEWLHSRRIWVAFLVSGLFMTLSALNSWLQANLPAEPGEPALSPVTDPMLILLGAVSSQIFAVVAIFAVMGLLVAERESGTLAWTASKPVSRSGIWLAKWTSAIGVLWLVAGLLPFAATVGLVIALYGALSATPLAILAIGIGLSIAFYVTVALAVSTVVTSQAAVAAVALALMFLPQLLGLFVSPELLPTSILPWTVMISAGESPGLVTPVVWLVSIAALIAFSLNRMEGMEL